MLRKWSASEKERKELYQLFQLIYRASEFTFHLYVLQSPEEPVEDWIWDRLRIQNPVDVQGPYIKWHSIFI